MSQKMKNTLVLIGVILGVIILLSIVGSILYISLFTDKEITIDIETIVSIILALFSIFISILFYFKATETSNRFYDNSFNFMKDQSVLLGRIEERFGAQLGNLEKQLINIQGLNLNNEDIYKKLDEVISVKDELSKKLLEPENIINEEEKRKLLAELENKNKIITKLTEKARKTSDQINKSWHEIKYTLNLDSDSRINEHRFLDYLYDLTASVKIIIDNDLREIIRELTSINNWYTNEEIKGLIIKKLSNWLITRPQMPKKQVKNYIIREVKYYLDNLRIK